MQKKKTNSSLRSPRKRLLASKNRMCLGHVYWLMAKESFMNQFDSFSATVKFFLNINVLFDFKNTVKILTKLF